jgi:rSAM/selenodomain-associated transferase 1
MSTTILVIAKAPVPGRVKTRLCPPCRPSHAAAIAAAALHDTLATVERIAPGRCVLVLDGSPPAGIPSVFTIRPQVRGGLDDRLAAAFGDETGPTILVGMDTPQLRSSDLTAGIAALDDHDAVIGPARDGGFWLVGMREPDPAVFPGVPMSTSATGAAQLARLRGRFPRVARLHELDDVDHWDDAVRVAHLVPDGRFAAAVHSVQQSLANR